MKLVNMIIGMIDINNHMTILDGNIMMNSFLDKIIETFPNVKNNVYGATTNQILYDINNIPYNILPKPCFYSFHD